MAKVSKNQRTNRGLRTETTPMAKIVVAEKKANGEYRYRERIVRQDDVQNVLKEAKAGQQ